MVNVPLNALRYSGKKNYANADQAMVRKILIIFAHPAFQKSRVNKYLIDGLSQIDGVTFHDLYQCYPDFDFDIQGEQRLLEEHDALVFHHPFFWYSTPAILKEWQDLVLEHGWAYGSQGDALRGKLFFNIITTGGSAETYYPKGQNHFTVRQLLTPIEQTVSLCKMLFLPPYVVHGTHSIDEKTVRIHRENYHRLLIMFRDGTLNIEKACQLNYLNDYLRKPE